MAKKIMRAFLLEESDLKKVKELAEKRGCSANAIVRFLIRQEAEE